MNIERVPAFPGDPLMSSRLRCPPFRRNGWRALVAVAGMGCLLTLGSMARAADLTITPEQRGRAQAGAPPYDHAAPRRQVPCGPDRATSQAAVE